MEARMQAEVARNLRAIHGPAWRIKSAHDIAFANGPVGLGNLDPTTKQTAAYLAMQASSAAAMESPGRAAEAFPHVDAAIKLQENAALTDSLKLLILANVPAPNIANRTALDPEVVTLWEALYFDVRPLLGATSWLATHVVDQERQTGNGSLAAKMKLVLAAGIEGAEAVLALDTQAPLDEAQRLFNRRLKLELKFDEAVNMPICTDEFRMRFLELFVKLQIEEKRLELARMQLEARCAERCERAKRAKSQSPKSTSLRVPPPAQEDAQVTAASSSSTTHRSAQPTTDVQTPHPGRTPEKVVKTPRTAARRTKPTPMSAHLQTNSEHVLTSSLAQRKTDSSTAVLPTVGMGKSPAMPAAMFPAPALSEFGCFSQAPPNHVLGEVLGAVRPAGAVVVPVLAPSAL